MKKTLLLGAATLMALTSVGASAADFQQYTALKFNYNMMNMKASEDGFALDFNDNNYGGSLAYGVKIADFRTELEGTLNRDAKKTILGEVSTKLDTKTLFLNAYYDINTGSKWTPYVGGGLGVAKLKAKASDGEDSISKSSNEFAWQLGAGMNYAITDNWSLDAGYRYNDYGKLTDKEDGDKLDIDVKSHTFYLGVRFTFS